MWGMDRYLVYYKDLSKTSQWHIETFWGNQNVVHTEQYWLLVTFYKDFFSWFHGFLRVTSFSKMESMMMPLSAIPKAWVLTHSAPFCPQTEPPASSDLKSKNAKLYGVCIVYQNIVHSCGTEQFSLLSTHMGLVLGLGFVPQISTLGKTSVYCVLGTGFNNHHYVSLFLINLWRAIKKFLELHCIPKKRCIFN